ncbi:CAP domain-containing protein [Evansella cellulosilytica]|uniref:SCP-like extracellular n=1 Tax=Evansella cellulosilytica (strain ATCC 21833 / DSM 2522 / FERM P-1141 / JCM 9156 / N-4) TaxID=649639 RepID=E6TRA6_EVAC2|nr:CAP domain-containing protein [Evansella cellulosilytica]ADU30618.1 SCP-like extracellular [Evansella cellulosilytica DSM 2522]
MKKFTFFTIILFVLIFTFACNGTDDDLFDEGATRLNNEDGAFADFRANDFNDSISSESTTMSSNEFPHTKAVQIQEAKFEFQVDTDENHEHIKNGQKWGDMEQRARQWVQDQKQSPRQNKQAAQEGDNVPNQQNEHANQEQTEQEPQSEQQPEQEQQSEQPEQDQTPTPGEEEEGQEGISDVEQRVIALTNEQRRNNGLSELQADSSLSNVARTKSTDMQENNYFSHTSPTYGSPFDMIRDFGVSYNAAAENIAQGQQTPEQVVDAWMNSQGHRENILNGNFTHIGVGYDPNGHHWTQMFISR